MESAKAMFLLKSREDVICWQLADELRRLIANLRWLNHSTAANHK